MAVVGTIMWVISIYIHENRWVKAISRWPMSFNKGQLELLSTIEGPFSRAPKRAMASVYQEALSNRVSKNDFSPKAHLAAIAFF
jgi:hypothetical protein